MRYWLMKSEPDVFSLEDLRARPGQTEPWDGVRNYQARNFMREMQVGDRVFFYHSNASPPGIAGMAEIAGAARPDPTQFDPQSKYFDAKSTAEKPRWDLVDVRFVRAFPALIPLETLKNMAELAEMPLVRKGSRLSVMPVAAEHWQIIMELVDG
ncbi:MAG: EVE domain-containing protein [Cardiobacteriaceae bacterium]|nr:EVE domain-containing protein [Cardiobacteriaceae bacterium]